VPVVSCTRWVLPFLLLPVPTTPPVFLLLFLLSLILHARPCVYCIGFLISLFLSSYYWSPVPSSELPAAIATLEEYRYNGKPVLDYLPPMIQLLDRPWVDHSYGGLFEPFNVSQWEADSVRYSVARAIRAEMKAEAKAAEMEALANQTDSTGENSTESGTEEGRKAEPLSTLALYMKTMDAFQRSWFSVLEIIALPRYFWLYGKIMIAAQTSRLDKLPEEEEAKKKRRREPKEVVEGKPLWWGLRSQYDLNPYGLDITVRLWPMDE